VPCGVNEGNLGCTVRITRLYTVEPAVMKRLNAAVALVVVGLVIFPFDGLAWNIPGHMLSGAIGYRIV